MLFLQCGMGFGEWCTVLHFSFRVARQCCRVLAAVLGSFVGCIYMPAQSRFVTEVSHPGHVLVPGGANLLEVGVQCFQASRILMLPFPVTVPKTVCARATTLELCCWNNLQVPRKQREKILVLDFHSFLPRGRHVFRGTPYDTRFTVAISIAPSLEDVVPLSSECFAEGNHRQTANLEMMVDGIEYALTIGSMPSPYKDRRGNVDQWFEDLFVCLVLM
jgi:hypothetical protein